MTGRRYGARSTSVIGGASRCCWRPAQTQTRSTQQDARASTLRLASATRNLLVFHSFGGYSCKRCGNGIEELRYHAVGAVCSTATRVHTSRASGDDPNAQMSSPEGVTASASTVSRWAYRPDPVHRIHAASRSPLSRECAKLENSLPSSRDRVKFAGSDDGRGGERASSFSDG